MKNDDLVWVEKYRPDKIQDCILPERLKKVFLGFVKKKSFPNLLLSGGAGQGKTTAARALCKELGYDSILINASDERNLDVVRNTIRNFASTMSFSGNHKAVILDECDSMTVLAQSALRAAIEEFKTVTFILTCNYKNKLIDPLKSRTTEIDFRVLSEEKTKMMVFSIQRMLEILDIEKITYEKKAVAEVVKRHYPDNRRILNELQRYSVTGHIDSGILVSSTSANVEDLIKAVKDQNLKICREWLANNSDLEPEQIFVDIYTEFYKVLDPNYIPEFLIKLGQYQFHSAMVANQEINFMAFLSDIITSAQFK